MKQKNNKHSAGGIRWKLFGYLAAFTAVIVLILWLCQVVFLEDIYRTVKTAEIKAAAVGLSHSVNDSESLADAAGVISEKNDVCVLVLEMLDGETAKKLVSCDAVRNCAIHNMSMSGYFKLYDSAKANGGKFLQHYRYDAKSRAYIAISPGDNSGDPESIIYAFTVHGENGHEVLFILNSVVSPVGATVRTLNFLLIAVSVVMIGLALLLAVLISRKISMPIIDINNSAQALAEGKYDVRFAGGSYREISELSDTLNYAATELSKVDGLRRELIANTSHDLRTPLTMITGYAEIMRDLPGENTPENAQVIIDESKRLTSLVNDMLDISKLESGNQQIQPEEFNLTETLEAGMERYNQFRTRDGYHIDFISPESVTVYTDKSKFLQAFYNIVNNAITYTGADKRVVVRQDVYAAQDGKKWVRVSVTDTGEGIPEDKLALIWDRYYKIDSAHKRAAQGTGLGLSIVNRIMTLLGGKCGVESRVGVGSTFFIEIPAE